GIVPGVTLSGTGAITITGVGNVAVTSACSKGYGSSGTRSTGTRGGLSGGGNDIPLLIRADITYLRQDFSIQQPLTTLPGTNLTTNVRFDYLVRLRGASPKAAKEMRNLPRDGELSEQRQAA